MPQPRWTYASFGCATFADNGRTYAYHKWAEENGLYPSDCCPDLQPCACPNDDAVWTDPITDNAPWIDPALPESEEFIGVMIKTVQGARDSTFSREIADNFADGSILGRPKLKGRQMVFDMYVLGTSCAGVDYGIEWLRQLTESGICACSSSDPCENCTGSQLTLRVYCSDVNEDCDTGLRMWDSVGVVDGVKVIDDDELRQLCCCIKHVTMTLQTESPYSHSCEIEQCDIPADDEEFARCYDWLIDCKECSDCQSACDRCGYDALCTCFPISDTVIEVPENECFCEPLQKIIQCCCIDELQDYSALKIDIFSGLNTADETFTELGLRNLTIKVFNNPDLLPCITDDDTWQVWADLCPELLRFELQVAYIPSNATLSIDGKRQRVTLTCDGVCRPYDQVVTNLTGSLFPLIADCEPIMVCAEWDVYNTQFENGGGALPSSMNVTTYRRWLN